MTGLGGWEEGKQAESSQKLRSSVMSAISLVCVSVSGAPGGRLCFAFFFLLLTITYSSAAGVGVVSPCVSVSAWRV